MLLRIFAPIFMSNIDLQFSYNRVDIEAMLTSSVGSIHSFSTFRKSLCSLGVISSLKVWRNSPVKPPGAEIFLLLESFQR